MESHGGRRLVGYSPWGRRVRQKWVASLHFTSLQFTSLHFCMERCKSLGSLKSFLSYSSQLSGASILCFHTLSFLRADPRVTVCCLLDGRCSFPSWIPSGLTSLPMAAAAIADDCDILFYWYSRQYAIYQGFPGDTSGKEPACQGRRSKRCSFNPWVGTIPGERNGNPLQGPCLENPMDRGSWQLSFTGLQRLDCSNLEEAAAGFHLSTPGSK